MKPINHNLRRWLIRIGIAAAAIFLLAIIFRGCLPINSHKEGKKEVQQISEAVNQADDSTMRITTAANHRADSLQKVIDAQDKRLKQTSQELAVSRRQVKELAVALDEAKALGDTSQFFAVADSLKNVALAQAQQAEQYEKQADSTAENYKRQLALKDITIKAQAELISKMRTANLEITDKYNSLHADYGKVTRKLKGERTLSRVLACAALIAGGLFIAK